MTATREKKSRFKMGRNRRLGKRRRGQGNRGGTGNAGGGKRQSQKLEKVVKARGGVVGKKKILKPKYRSAAINIDTINTIVIKKDIKPKNGVVSINLEEFGFGKLLARGKPTFKYEITCEEASEHAKEKIKKAGGKVIAEEASEHAKEKIKKAGGKVIAEEAEEEPKKEVKELDEDEEE